MLNSEHKALKKITGDFLESIQVSKDFNAGIPQINPSSQFVHFRVQVQALCYKIIVFKNFFVGKKLLLRVDKAFTWQINYFLKIPFTYT